MYKLLNLGDLSIAEYFLPFPIVLLLLCHKLGEAVSRVRGFDIRMASSSSGPVIQTQCVGKMTWTIGITAWGFYMNITKQFFKRALIWGEAF